MDRTTCCQSIISYIFINITKSDKNTSVHINTFCQNFPLCILPRKTLSTWVWQAAQFRCMFWSEQSQNSRAELIWSLKMRSKLLEHRKSGLVPDGNTQSVGKAEAGINDNDLHWSDNQAYGHHSMLSCIVVSYTCTYDTCVYINIVYQPSTWNTVTLAV